MRYSQMSDQARKMLLDDPEYYPWRVRFLGKGGILCYEEIAFLRQEGVDFDIDDQQASAALRELAEEGKIDLPASSIQPHGPKAATVWYVAAGAAVVSVLMRLLRRGVSE